MPSSYRLRDLGSGTIVADRVRPAHTHWTRLRGLLGTAPLAPGQGLWLKPCRQVHMLGMRYAIDVLFLADDLRVLHAVSGLRPGTISPKVVAATSVLELPAGTLRRSGLDAGAQVALEQVAEKGPSASLLGRSRLAADPF